MLGDFLRDVIKLNLTSRNFRLFGPDETASNRLDAVYEVTGKAWMAEVEAVDMNLSPDGRVMEVLSEHLCQGWLEGYLLTGRHGFFSCYEAFIHVVDSMVNQHAKWLKTTRQIEWRRPIASLNYLLTSHVWQQDHNGFSHQDPGFIDHVAKKKAGRGAHLPAAGRQLPALGRRSLPAQSQLHQPDRRRKSARMAVARYRRGRAPLRRRGGRLGLGRHLQRRSRGRHGLLRRRADAGDPGGGDPAAGLRARPARARGQCRRPHGAAAADRTSARPRRPATSTRCSPATGR